MMERKRRNIGIAGGRTIYRRTPKIRTLITITSVLLLLQLHIVESVAARAYVPLIPFIDLAFNATLGGPAPGAAGTPRKRGPLPPPTRGRGRLPIKRARSLMGPGPQLPWHNASFPYRNFLAEPWASLERRRSG